MYITDMHACLCKLLSTPLVCTRVFCMRSSTSQISCAHAHLYVSEMRNVSCRVHDACVFSQVYIELYHVYFYYFTYDISV